MSDFLPFDNASGDDMNETLPNSSDFEPISSHPESKEVSVKDYWFGKKYFECVVAQNLIMHATGQHSVAKLDVSPMPSIIGARKQKLTYIGRQGLL